MILQLSMALLLDCQRSHHLFFLQLALLPILQMHSWMLLCRFLKRPKASRRGCRRRRTCQVTERTKELHNNEVKLPYQKLMPCLAENNACLACYKKHAKDPLKCAYLLRKFRGLCS
ncbi:hypothetical protein ACJRO7_020248 [Eucalyptus globulus]|uniref:Uncharacterized protein n=1 Tax=Eucalyptus globulus TaxID=34317 RepID=A0ABD3KHL3_EUCGL